MVAEVFYIILSVPKPGDSVVTGRTYERERIREMNEGRGVAWEEPMRERE